MIMSIICSFISFIWAFFMFVSLPTRYLIKFLLKWTIFFYNPFTWIKIASKFYNLIKSFIFKILKIKENKKKDQNEDKLNVKKQG